MVNAARPIIGIDWGVSYDQSAAVLIYRLAGIKALNPDHDGRPVFIACAHVWPAGYPLGDVVADVRRWGLPWAYLSIETLGVGAGPWQQIRRELAGVPPKKTWNPVATSAPASSAAFGCVGGLLDNDQLLLDPHPQLKRQLRGLQYEQGSRFMKIGASDDAVHDDVADALMLAMCPHRRNGRIRCQLQQLADPNYAPPETPLPHGYDDEIVETGCGLRLFRHPVLQSVEGHEVTVPLPVPQQTGPRRIGGLLMAP